MEEERKNPGFFSIFLFNVGFDPRRFNLASLKNVTHNFRHFRFLFSDLHKSIFFVETVPLKEKDKVATFFVLKYV